jgi:signal recognition particle receptor subunit beta
MAYVRSDDPSTDPATGTVTGTGSSMPVAVKILIAGGFGVGKTTMVGSLSEVEPLRTEELITAESIGVDDLSGVEGKDTTTVALDFGRITLEGQLILYLFGTPGQDRFWFVWDELALGAIGAVVLADTRRLDGSFQSVDFFEKRGLPFVVAVNCFDGAERHETADIRIALDLDDDVAVLLCDARDRASTKEVLVTLVEEVIRRSQDQVG